MKGEEAVRRVFFEPWSLGDVIIAAAALQELPWPTALACHSAWHPLLRCALAGIPGLELIAVDLPYTTRRRANPFDTGAGTANASHPEFAQVLSIRGDFRDWRAARRIFPNASIRMNGWARFWGRKSAAINFPYSLGTLSIENRYRSWARLAGVPYAQIEATYQRSQRAAPKNRSTVIHLGAQWRSKQYPEVRQLRDALRKLGQTVKILAGPRDPLPTGLEESDVIRASDERLVDELRAAGNAITNDSGPMHVAAFLGCRTLAIVRTSPIEEWSPPAASIVRSAETPRGYRPDRRYMSDEVLSGWPPVEEIVANLALTI